MEDQQVTWTQYFNSLDEAEKNAIAARIRPWGGGRYADFKERTTAIAEALNDLHTHHADSMKTRAEWTLLLERTAQTALWRLRKQEESSWWAKHTVNEVWLNGDGEEQSTYDSTAGTDPDPESAWLAAEEAAELRHRLVLALHQAVAEAVAAHKIPDDEASEVELTLRTRILAQADGESRTWMECCQMTGYEPKKASKYWKICEIRLLELVHGNAGGHG